jgi:hypothetical protein
LLNPANSPSRRPDYKAQEEPSLVQTGLLASRLVGSDPGLSETARPLYNTVKCYSSLVQKELQASKLVESNSGLSETARLSTGLCDTGKC